LTIKAFNQWLGSCEWPAVNMPLFNFSAPRAFSLYNYVGTLPFQFPLTYPYVITSKGGATPGSGFETR
jgi:hypothetical protein